jgi:predicted lipoprotein with Yx(FWY)xxD motif
MRKIFALAVALVVFLAFGIAAADLVKVEKKEGIGSYLTDSKGMTIYYFTKDTIGKSACEGDCITRWPIFYDKKIKAPKGVNKKDFGVITRADKKKQSTFRGMPLYHFFKDAKAGDTNGQGLNNVWYVIDPATFKAK